MLRNTYNWILSWGHSRHAPWALFVLAFTESSFFPIPPDVLLMALAVSRPVKAFRYALICSVGSVLGGIFGYFIGFYFMDAVGMSVIDFYGLSGKFEYIQALYTNYDAWAVGIAGFTPIPYKVFTITAGAFGIDFKVFVLASLVSRSARFFIIALLIYKYGEPIKGFIDKYLGWLTIAFVVILILGFALVKIVLH
ncbi:FIG139438: lipoprotein B [hydrothermal vent metagenome]|uniref:FIG139438: lipoprotein B n=1 Tax=hydrothermal vent metagenome TaxID=652676 RepID=A0A3B0QW87_9ZZZZ